jgi:hypothetical protein
MNGWRQLVAMAIAIAMIHLGVADAAWSAVPTTVASPAAVKQQIDQLGVGAKVKIRLANGKKLNGTILAIEDGTFSVASAGSSRTSVAYDQVAQLKLARNTYKSKGTVDRNEVRRVLVALGVGRHIMVKTTAGEEYHGNILTIGNDSFKILPDHQSSSVEIPNDETLQLGPNLSTGSKVLIGVLVACAVLITVGVIVLDSRDD